MDLDLKAVFCAEDLKLKAFDTFVAMSMPNRWENGQL